LGCIAQSLWDCRIAGSWYFINHISSIVGTSSPRARFRQAPLEFATVFADEERQIFAAGQLEVRRKDFFERVQSRDAPSATLESAQPVFPRREFLEPGVGRGNDKLAAGADERGELLQTPPRLAQPVNQVCHQYYIELAQVGARVLSVTLFKGYTLPLDLRWH